MRRDQLDGLRFFLFVFVFLTHHFPFYLEFLGYALPVFFVMSGFLITNVLLIADQPTTLGKLRVFYLRRILRIFPSYYLVVAVLWISGSLSFPWYYMAYLVNIKLFSLSLDLNPIYFKYWFFSNVRSESMHLWSLSVEEQFYILYPLLLFVTPARLRTLLLLGLIAGSIAARVWFIDNLPLSFYGALLPICVEYLAWGALFAWLQYRGHLTGFNADLVVLASAVGVVMLIVVEFQIGFRGFYQFSTTNFQSPIAVLMGFFIWGLYYAGQGHPLVRFLRYKPFVYFGSMSYTMYLVHLMTWDLWRWSGLDLPFSAKVDEVIGTWCLTTIIAMTIWHLVEKPANDLKRFIPYD